MQFFDDRLPTRFWDKIVPEPMSGCWLWKACIDRDGYGEVRATIGGCRFAKAHRLSFAVLVGPVPFGMVLDHKCRTRSCVNPDHLEAVTSRTNTLRGAGFAAENFSKTHCHRGHEFSEANTMRRRGWRECRKCIRLLKNMRRREQRATRAVGEPK